MRRKSISPRLRLVRPQTSETPTGLIGGIILNRTGEPAGELLPDPNPAWLNEHSIPKRVQDAFRATDHELTLGQWTALTPLQRFALIKLTRPGHETASKFLQAVKEFDLLP